MKAKRDHEEKLNAILEEHSMKEDQGAKMEEQAQMYETRITQLKLESEQNIKKLSS